jgi:hypothetical protein
MKKLFALLTVGAALLLATPTDATPINTVFDRNLGGCTFEMVYGNFGGPYANARTTHMDGSPPDCKVLSIKITYSTSPGNLSNYTCADTGLSWEDTDWHSCNRNVASYTIVGAVFFLTACQGDNRYDWKLTAAIADGLQEGQWTYQSTDTNYPYCNS